MELFLANGSLIERQRSLTQQQGDAWLLSAVDLSWHLRQRDCAQALALADAAQTRLMLHPDARIRRGLMARLTLVRAEVSLLFGEIDSATEGAMGCTTVFAELEDEIGRGDTHWLLASIAVDRGDSAQVASRLQDAIAAYGAAGDAQRVSCARARSLVNASFREPVATAALLARHFPLDTDYSVCAMAWVAAARANVAGLTGDPGASIQHDLTAWEAALECGQVRHALVSVANAAESFATLGDLDSALEWSERGLALARSTQWPASIGFCLMQLGDVMRQLGRHDESRAFLREALDKMRNQSGSRNYVLGLGNLGQLAIDVGDYQAGLDSFTQLEQQVLSLTEPDLIIRAWRGQASALFHLGELHEAQLKAVEALNLATQHGSADAQIQVLRILADMHMAHSLAPPEDCQAPTAALHFLEWAWRVTGTIPGYEAPPELLEQLALARAHAGQFEAAYRHCEAASIARARSRTKAAQNRAVALQVRQQVEQARADTEHHRKLAATLKETAATLETLGIIGREITASLDTGAVFDALHRNVHQLLDATAFAVYLVDLDATGLTMVFGVEAGIALPISRVPLSSPTAHSARCARERKEVLIEIEPGVVTANWIPGTLPTLSLLYAPLMIGERVLGVMTIQSPRQHVYGERERSIFLTLCAYGAIALDNARAYGVAAEAQRRADMAVDELRLAQARLVQDIAERERIELELQALNNELETRIAARTQEMQTTLTQLATSRQKLQGIVDTALDAVIRVDADGTIVGWNRQAQVIFGWTPSQAIGRPLHTTIIPLQYRENHVRGMQRYMAGAPSTIIDKRIEITALHQSGREFPIELAVTRVVLDDPTKFEFCSFIRDISQRRLAEDEVRASLEKQRELNQLKSRFVAMASHEFRTPLATIQSSADLLSQYYERLPVSERKDLFGSIGTAVRRMTKMLEDILVIEKDEAERIECRPSQVDVGSMCRDIIQEVRSEIGPTGIGHHTLQFALHGSDTTGWFDERLMRHILGNLLSNAVKYSPEGGVVDLSVTCGEGAFVFVALMNFKWVAQREG
jgi:PAS domain S-box-containing protein